MTPTRRAAFAACIPLVLLFGPCAAENALVSWLANAVNPNQKEEPPPDTNEPLKVFSVGLSRTGTMSLKAAFDELGYNTWHGNLIDTTYAELLSNSYKTGDPTRFLDKLASEGYNASVEFMYFPVVLEALARYPEARVILSVRENSEKWVESYINALRVGVHMSIGILPFLLELFTSLRQDLFFTMWCGNFVWLLGGASTTPADWMAECPDQEAVQRSRWYNMFFNDLELPETRVTFNAVYERMNADLRKAVPQERFLEFNVKQGYGPLCLFLGVAEGACPATFPHINAAWEMQAAKYAFAAFRYGWWVPFLMFFLCVRSCCCRRRKVQKND